MKILSAEKCPQCKELWDVVFLRNGIHWKYFCKKNKKRKVQRCSCGRTRELNEGNEVNAIS